MDIQNKPILIASLDENAIDVFNGIEIPGFTLRVISPEESIESLLKEMRFEFLILDIRHLLPDNNVAQETLFISKIVSLINEKRVVLLTPESHIKETVSIIGSLDCQYLQYPLVASEIPFLLNNLERSVISASELNYLRQEFWSPDSLPFLRTSNPKMREVLKKIESVAKTTSTIILYGESGTGKGVLANLIHTNSNRKNNSFITVHTGAIPDNLIESELFGHEKGSFTGAIKRKLGKFELAQNGTIFLDEIGTITSATQIRLLQILQEKKFQRVGGECDLESNARIISATNEDLKARTKDGNFRLDLYYRLNVFPIEVPPLRERSEDIPELAKTILTKLNASHGRDISKIHPLVLEALMSYQWPGNIREFENILERAYILESSESLTPESFPHELFESLSTTESTSVEISTSKTLAEARAHAIAEFERNYLKMMLEKNQGKINASASEAGITTRQLHKLLLKHGIRKEEFKKSQFQV